MAYDTAQELQEAGKALAARISGSASVTLMVTNTLFSAPSSAAVLMIEAGPRIPTKHIRAPTWDEAFAQADAWVSEHAAAMRSTTVRRMALSIIDLSGGTNFVLTVPQLVEAGFARDDVFSLADDAVALASTLTGGQKYDITLEEAHVG